MPPHVSFESEMYGKAEPINVVGDLNLTDNGNGTGSLNLPQEFVEKARSTRNHRWGATGILKIQPNDAGKVFINSQEYTGEEPYIFEHLVQYYFFTINENLPKG